MEGNVVATEMLFRLAPAQQGGPGDPNSDPGWKSFMPVGILLGGDLDFFVGGGGELGAGGILVIRGPDAGKFVTYLDYGVGLGLDLSAVVEGGLIFYTGNADEFTINTLKGARTEVGLAAGMIGANVFLSSQDAAGGRVVGVLGTYGPGINPLVLFGIPTPFTGNVNHGETSLFQLPIENEEVRERYNHFGLGINCWILH